MERNGNGIKIVLLCMKNKGKQFMDLYMYNYNLKAINMDFFNYNDKILYSLDS